MDTVLGDKQNNDRINMGVEVIPDNKIETHNSIAQVNLAGSQFTSLDCFNLFLYEWFPICSAFYHEASKLLM